MGFRLLLGARPKQHKTGALAALANAGYTLRYVNHDDNTEPLFAFSRKDAHRNIQVLDAIDEMRVSKEGNIVSTGAQGLKSWNTLMSAMDRWPVDGSDPAKWTKRDVLCIDSLTELAKGLARRQQAMEGRELKRYSWTDYDRVQKQIDALLVLLKGRLVNASLIVIAHLQVIGPDFSTGDTEDEALRDEILRQKLRGADNIPWQLAPISFGKAQAKTLAGHFSGSLYCKTIDGRGRVICTVPEDGFDAGVPISGLPKELPVATGLATVFDAITGGAGVGKTAAARPAAAPRPAVPVKR